MPYQYFNIKSYIWSFLILFKGEYMGRTPMNVIPWIWDTYHFEKMPCGDGLLSVDTVQLPWRICLLSSLQCPWGASLSLSLSLLFIEHIQGTQAWFSSAERHIRISTYGDFSRTLKWFKCCWIPFDFGLACKASKTAICNFRSLPHSSEYADLLYQILSAG